MAVVKTPAGEQNLHLSDPPACIGTLAIDLGSSTTVVAFQRANQAQIELLELPAISREQGSVPSLIWAEHAGDGAVLVGRQVLEGGLNERDAPQLHRDFKRQIGQAAIAETTSHRLSPEQAGARLLLEIWKRMPPELTIERLVLTAPVDQGAAYCDWLVQACAPMDVGEVALVDEPTAAALGAGLAAGSKLLVVDLGGGTLDLSLVALEGGEGRAAPLAQLLRFRGKDLRDSRQTLRQATVLGKAGINLGGRDFDRWILDALQPEGLPGEGDGLIALLNAAERLKCRLSDSDRSERETLIELASSRDLEHPVQLRMDRQTFSQLLSDRGLFTALEGLLEQTLKEAELKGCRREDLDAVVLVGGGAHLPQLKQWLEQALPSTPMLTPPPMAAVAKGALSLTPGVRLQDLLQKGISLRCWNRRSHAHHWHPLFMRGQPWPSSQPLELVLSASNPDQTIVELVLGEAQPHMRHEVVMVDGLPQVLETSESWTNVNRRDGITCELPLVPPGQPGEDCLKLRFHLNDKAELILEGDDLRTGAPLERQVLGTVR
ncbi:Hsp70 family protein [Synechococcus sp. A18-25c]|uniref:Hsp70 family protein n=1 Tax=Synechococcus sp. A18-25c TaxID=1866938 RepID=UPI001648C125|nr:Hsp70 family protein [Synechococcus sp. A18-25c]